MEKKLKELFNYQRFEKNERLAKLIGETEDRYSKGLSDDDLSLVNAAGDMTIAGRQDIGNEGGGGGGAGGGPNVPLSN